jgi:hypothetical protein
MTPLATTFEDDGARLLLPLPFPFLFGGVDFSGNANGGIFASSNGYILFGGSSTAWENLGPSNPPLRSLHVGSKEASWQGLWAQDQGSGTTRRLRVRYEGYSGYKQLLAPDVIWEASLWASNNSITLCVGANALAGAAGVQSGVGDGSRWLASYQLAADTQYVISGVAAYASASAAQARSG